MGCASSKHVQVKRMLRGHLADDPPILVGDKKNPSPGHQARSVGIPAAAPQAADSGHRAPVPLNDTMEGLSAPLSTTSTAQRRFSGWVVRPGYSSGASSVAMDDEEEEEEDEEQEDDEDGLDEVPEMRAEVTLSKHTNVLALSDLRRQNQLGHNLASSVVRIETPFDTPIESIYDGLTDGDVLGSGASGVVRLVTHKATGVKYAVKCLDLDMIESKVGLQQLREEIFIMCQLDHPNIVRIEEVYESACEIFIVQEYLEGGDLFERLDAQPDFHYNEAQCARLAKQILSSVRYLHSKGIIHRDLKLENFMFGSRSANSELKMIDFGLSKHFSIGEVLCERVGTPYSVSPEILNGSYDEKSDMWAIGVITYLLLGGETPFGGLDGESLLVVRENIMRAQVKFVPTDTWDHVSEDGKAFVKQLLHPDPKKRPGAKEMQRCKWIQVWAKKDASQGHRLSGRTVSALMKFKESSDMQKLLSEVLSFTLLPEQIVELRKEFEKIDGDGDGQITLSSLKHVLVQNAEVGALGGLSEKEVEEIFDSIKVRKGGEPTLYWHEFLAAGLSQARVDERNLKLAFDRLDTHRHGYLTYEDLSQIGKIFFESNHLERIWSEGLLECKCKLNRIYFEDFKKLMKGQPKDIAVAPKLASIPSGAELHDNAIIEDVVRRSACNAMEDNAQTSPSRSYGKPRSASYELKSPKTWEDETTETRDASSARHIPTRSMLGPVNSMKELDPDLSPLASNRALYRKHREMRLAVLDASKQFDSKRKNRSNPGQAGLTMRRGSILLPAELDDTHTRALFANAAHRSGRRTRREKTVSDVTGMISFS